MLLSFLLSFLIVSFTSSETAVRSHLEPVILVPGLGGSRIEYTTDNSTWHPLWLSISEITTKYKEWSRLMAATYNDSADEFQNLPGITTRPVNFAGVHGIDYLDPSVGSLIGYMNKLIDGLTAVGFQVGKNLFGAPYDFRLANGPQVLRNGMMAKLQRLVEYVYEANNKTKVHLLGHSCGCVFIHSLITKYCPKDWAQKYVASFISISGPFGGSFEAFAHLVGPHKWSLVPVPGSFIHPFTKELGSMVWMLPNTNAYPTDYVLATVSATGQRVTVGGMSSLLQQIGNTRIANAVQRSGHLNATLPAPHVPVHLIYSDQCKTAARFLYNSTDTEKWFEKDPETIYGDGDDTVPIESLQAPLKWKSEQSEPVIPTIIHKATHNNIVANSQLISTVVDIVSSN